MKLSIAGGILGISLSLSLRRYLPNIFGDFGIFRFATEIVLVFGCYTQFTKMGTYNSNESL